jgi:hypothetical protein
VSDLKARAVLLADRGYDCGRLDPDPSVDRVRRRVRNWRMKGTRRRGNFRSWHEAEVPSSQLDVCCRGRADSAAAMAQ